MVSTFFQDTQGCNRDEGGVSSKTYRYTWNGGNVDMRIDQSRTNISSTDINLCTPLLLFAIYSSDLSILNGDAVHPIQEFPIHRIDDLRIGQCEWRRTGLDPWFDTQIVQSGVSHKSQIAY